LTTSKVTASPSFKVLKPSPAMAETSLMLIDAIPDDCIAVSESGLRSAADLAKLRAAGFDAFLIGETLMRQPDPAAVPKAQRRHPLAAFPQSAVRSRAAYPKRAQRLFQLPCRRSCHSPRKAFLHLTW
jgi:hypothetical protein